MREWFGFNDPRCVLPIYLLRSHLTLTNASLAAEGTRAAQHRMNGTHFKLSVDVSKRVGWEGITLVNGCPLLLGHLRVVS